MRHAAKAPMNRSAQAYSPFGGLLRYWRIVRGLSQLALAIEAGISTPAAALAAVSAQGDVPVVMLQRAQREVLWIFEVGWVFFRHFLLPRGTHDPAGLMCASWRMENMRNAVQGHLRFSATEAAIIRARLPAGN